MSGREYWAEPQVFAALRHRFPAPAWILLPQVRNSVGSIRQARTADALAVSVWPSRGLGFDGIEIKVARSDWTKELADPAKSEEIQRFCQHWWIAAPQGVVPVDELPATWGLIECRTRGTQVVTTVVKQARELEPQPPTMLFVCSLLRAMAEACVPKIVIDERIAEARKEGQDAEKLSVNYEFKELRDKVAAFEAASGVQLGAVWECNRIGRVVRYVIDNGIDRILEQAADLRKQAERIMAATANITPVTICELVEEQS